MFSATSLLGRAVRVPLRAIPGDAIFPILTGPNRGMKWIVGSANHGHWIGKYEKEHASVLLAHLRADGVFWDLGAHVGWYTLFAARRCKTVIAFEPFPRNLAYLRRHIELNHIDNAGVIPSAVSNANGTSRFDLGSSSACGGLDDVGALEVETVKLDDCDIPPPTVIKMDIEGGEYQALLGATNIIHQHRPVIMLAVHTIKLATDCLKLLRDWGYAVHQIAPYEYLLVTD